MEARKVFWKKKYIIPNSPNWEISGYSRSSFRTGFYIKPLNIMLDAGPQSFKTPEHILITHSHADHIANLPFTLIGDEDTPIKPNIYLPLESVERVRRYVRSMFQANAMEDDIPIDNWFNFRGLSYGNSLDITANKNKLSVEVFSCDHPIPTISYGFGLKKTKLSSKYVGLSGKEIAQLKKEGVEISEEVVQKVFCYVCDTSIRVFEMNPTILDYQTIFIECTFLADGEELAAEKKSHIHWNSLKPIVLANPDKQFMLFHFSLKYKDQEIKEMMDVQFEKEGIKNVELWLPDLFN